jgi:sphinganine C4-monooxygenase
VGAILAQILAGLSIRQAIFFLVLTTVKTVDDHCGYKFSWDPLQLLTPNNTLFHDVHHQSWGIKHNFSQPFLIFWDKYLGTEYTGDTRELYKKSAASAKRAVEEDRAQATKAAAQKA